jgi:hypothetical protein
MRVVKFILIPLIIIILVYVGIVIFIEDDIEDAIDLFEEEEYVDSIKILNELIKVVGYEEGERVYYYRCKAINELSSQLEEEFGDELEEIGRKSDDEKEREGVKKYLEERIGEINNITGGDLALIHDKGRGNIISRGGFYDDFVSRYKGSRLIEDLDFEELQKIEKTESHKLFDAIVNFHRKYPNTSYISHLIKMLFKGFQRGDFNITGKQDFLEKLILQFARRYPTSSEFYRIYTCDADSVNVRNSPGIDGDIVSKTDKGEILIQLEKSMDSFQIGDTRDYWYRVASLKGYQGWIFGKFLKPLNISSFSREVLEEKWSLEEYFNEWIDSNTPKNWVHLLNSDTSTISFSSIRDLTVVKLNSLKGSLSGLYRRSITKGVFAIESKARFVDGDSAILVAYARYDGKVFYIKLMEEEIETSGRRIPLHTSDWHRYRLESDDGMLARLSVDGEVISSRISPVTSETFTMKGVYCLYSAENDRSLVEMEYIKIRD